MRPSPVSCVCREEDVSSHDAEASSMSTNSPAPDARRSVAIDFLFLELSTCGRCRESGANIEAAVELLEGVLQATGSDVEVRRIHVQSVEQARALRFVSSPTIRVNGRDIAIEARESECGPDACGCGAGASCRVWRYRGSEFTEAPVGLIVDAVLGELYAPRPDAADLPYDLPDELVRVLAGTGGGCCA
jgi:hypothetical protein